VNNGPTGILGKSVVVHRDPDDYKSQPAGNSGPRIACGLIK
jgi:Cu-Zn family superoxide dismutase